MSDLTHDTMAEVLGTLPEEQNEDTPTNQDIAPEEGIRPIRLSSVFNDPTANVVFKTSDNVLFRVDDFFLKANSAVFRDMLSGSIASSSTNDPLPISEKSSYFRIMLMIVTGRPEDAINEPRCWSHAEKLYLMMDKYQLDGHQPWFSQMCGRWVKEDPLAALFLACNRPCIDTTLARYAIEDGMSAKSCSELYDKRYFRSDWGGITARWILAPPNMTLDFGLRLGFKGLLAYNLTFADIRAYAPGRGTTAEAEDRLAPNWRELAIRFVDNARQIEQKIHSPRIEA